MAAGFLKAREYFDNMDLNGDKLIDIDEFTTMIDVYEFMLVFVVIQLLSPERAQHLPPEIHKTLEIVEDAFCCFDASEDGYLEPQEVAEVLCTSNTPGRATRALSDKLFAQLDFDGSGGISFKEFLIGLEKMVMEEYADDEDGEAGGGGAGGPDADEEEARLVEAAKRLAAQQRAPGAGAGGGGGGQRRRGQAEEARPSGDGPRRGSGSSGGSGGRAHSSEGRGHSSEGRTRHDAEGRH
ncbi:hypothetical protein MNEG_3541 [Monoraphidium neglectum]|uniref:EF-hand domain-containing protein n=1 Tax=Monoraphidium neglectum TaxID=145388 RepID=A0A0D2NHC7_9CHLO|nr:hypothetical protein MNEG_3541 [Monoraphidium neglectum]KIZ04416.1 hypothetical protein MNEG_3541 [Monoraphidium neglectum]|eukprot:XP_013903435.1 hypothetical protein MNEG_3541 [Monoraphidium neglectum]